MSTQPARGMRDFLPDEVRRRAHVIRTVADVYERYGFEPLETPAVENLETLMGKYGEEGNQLIFKILKRGEGAATGQADLALRYDLTVPLARVVAEYHSTLPRIFKRYQIQPVWRADRPARGRFREFYQCDVDIVGVASVIAEVELAGAASEALSRLGFRDFTMRVNHRQLLTALLDTAGIEASRHGDALVALDKIDKIGRDGVARELAARGIPDEAATRLMTAFADAVAASGPDGASGSGVLERIEHIVGHHPAGRRATSELRELVKLSVSSAAAGRIRIDPGLARGLSYYTGTIMELAVPDLAGSLGGGGRYDELVGMFLGRRLPACGFSLGLERILVVMAERGMHPPALTTWPADVMVALWSAESATEALALARDLRSAGLRVDVYPEAEKLGKQFKFASGRGIPFVAIVGDEERARGEVALKDLRSGEQRALARERVPTAIREGLGAPVP
jgi:histidyl-tRNA synthetase